MYQDHGCDRILIIDDEEFCLAAMRAILFKIGLNVDHRIDFCINGLEALEMAQNAQAHCMNYSLIFTDFNMPVMDGVEATKRLRQLLGDEPTIIGVTGYATNKYHKMGKEAGMNEVISKPVYIDTLRKIITKYYKTN
jgi:two-component system sensor histidine kinase/response regulator